MKAILSLLFSIIVSSLFAQAGLYYRVANNVTGNWNGAGVWETSTTGANPWTATSTPPNSTSLTILIGGGEHVTIPNGYSVSVDEVVIASSGSVTVASGGTFTVVDGSGIDLASNGAFTNSGSTTISSGAVFANVATITMSAGSLSVSGTITSTSTFTGTTTSNTTFNSGGRYRHLWTSTEGVIPLATWANGSTMEVAGYTQNTTATAGGNWGQSFYDVDISCAALGSNRILALGGLLTTVRNNLSVTATGTGTTKVILGASGSALTIGNTFSTSASTRTDIIAAAGTATVTSVNFSGSGTLTISSINTGSGILNVSGNFAVPAGTLTTNAAGPGATNGIGTINFNGTGSTQTYSRVGTISNNINYNILANAVVDVSTNTMPGTGTFILSGTLRTSNATGLTGSLPTTGAKTFNSGSTIYYNGALAQVMGTIYPASPAANVHVTIAKTGGSVVSTSLASTIVTGVLTLTSGTLNVSAAHTLQLESTVSTTSGNVSVNSGGNLTINGSGALGTDPFPFSGDQAFTNFTLNRSGAVVTFANNVSLNGALTMSAGTLAFPNQTLTLNGNISFAGACLFSSNGNSVLDIQGTGTGATIIFSPSGNSLNTLSIGRPGVTIGLGSDLTITNALNLNNGSLSVSTNTITMQGNSWIVDDLSGATFVPGTGTVIFDGTTTVSATNSADFNNVTLNALRSLDFPAATVNVSGNIDFPAAGTFGHNSGTILMNGASTQTFNGGGHDYYNITASKSGGAVTLTGGVNLFAVLNVLTATDFQSNGNLTLVSTADDPDVSASIGPIPFYGSGGDVSGDVNTQRFISLENRVYRYISSPVQGTTVADWIDDFSITGPFSGASTTDPVSGLVTFCGNTIKPTVPSMYNYNEALAGTAGYVAYPTSSTGQAIEQGRGYAAYIRESCFRTLQIDVTGEVNKGPIPLPVTFNGTPASPDDGWNLVGNPYPSAIRWDADGNGWTKGADLQTVVSITDNIGSGGAVIVFEGETIAQGQGFWVKADGPAASLSIDEAAKESAIASSFYRQASRVDTKKDMLEILVTKGAVTDKAYFRVLEAATAGYDRYDFPNQNNELFDIATLADSRQLAVNSVKSFTCGDVLPVHIKDMTNGTYTFAVDRKGLFAGMDVMLTDKVTGIVTNLSQVEEYQFNVTATAATKASDRFKIQLTLLREAQSTAGEICNEGTLTLNAIGNYEGGTYKWYETTESSSALHEGNTFDTPLLTEATTYYVAAVNAIGCEGARASVNVDVVNLPNPVVTVASANVLTSTAETGNQWYLNGEAIDGATSKQLTVTSSGHYEVVVNKNSCTKSAAMDYNYIHANENNPVVVFPNPVHANNELVIQIMAESVGVVNMVNSVGTVVTQVEMKQETPGIWTASPNMSALPNGVYFVRSWADNKYTTIKVVKAQ